MSASEEGNEFAKMNRTRGKCVRPRIRSDNVTFINSTFLEECVERTKSIPGGRRRRPCGSCTDACVFSAIEMCLVLGIIANIIVIIRVIKDRKLRSNTFVGIACLAFADSAFLLLNLTLTYELVIRRVTCTLPSQIRGHVFAFFMGVTWFSANGHVALMAILRYIILVYPIKSQAYLTLKRIILMSVSVWVLGFIIRGIFTLIIRLTNTRPRKSVLIFLGLWIIIYFLPLLVTITLHIMKVKLVKKTSHHSDNALVRKSVARMSKIIVVIIVCATLLPLPRMIFGIIDVVDEVKYPSRSVKSYFRSIAHLLFLVNNCINPCIYAFMSKPFRNSLMRMFGKEASEGDSSTGTVDTPVTRRRGTQDSIVENMNASQDSIATCTNITMEIFTETQENNRTAWSKYMKLIGIPFLTRRIFFLDNCLLSYTPIHFLNGVYS